MKPLLHAQWTQRVGESRACVCQHYGHRRLLTLALSSVDPAQGVLTVGVAGDGMAEGKGGELEGLPNCRNYRNHPIRGNGLCSVYRITR